MSYQDTGNIIAFIILFTSHFLLNDRFAGAHNSLHSKYMLNVK